MDGGQLVDVLAPHNLRPAHLNAIYARLAQLGADVTPVASESSTASHHARGAGHEHHDTASSCGGARRSAAGVGDHDGSVDADGGVAVEGAKAAKRGGYKARACPVLFCLRALMFCCVCSHCACVPLYHTHPRAASLESSSTRSRCDTHTAHYRMAAASALMDHCPRRSRCTSRLSVTWWWRWSA